MHVSQAESLQALDPKTLNPKTPNPNTPEASRGLLGDHSSWTFEAMRAEPDGSFSAELQLLKAELFEKFWCLGFL